MGFPVDEEYYNLLFELQTIDFSLVELTLYLDTHPTDYQAVEQFNVYSQKRMDIKNQFEARYGPLQQYGNSFSRYPWEWSEGPWPWQV